MELMSAHQTEVKTYRVTYHCDKCNNGMMRHDGIVLTSAPPKYPHTCVTCGDKKNFDCVYPKIEPLVDIERFEAEQTINDNMCKIYMKKFEELQNQIDKLNKYLLN